MLLGDEDSSEAGSSDRGAVGGCSSRLPPQQPSLIRLFSGRGLDSRGKEQPASISITLDQLLDATTTEYASSTAVVIGGNPGLLSTGGGILRLPGAAGARILPQAQRRGIFWRATERTGAAGE